MSSTAAATSSAYGRWDSVGDMNTWYNYQWQTGMGTLASVFGILWFLNNFMMYSFIRSRWFSSFRAFFVTMAGVVPWIVFMTYKGGIGNALLFTDSNTAAHALSLIYELIAINGLIWCFDIWAGKNGIAGRKYYPDARTTALDFNWQLLGVLVWRAAGSQTGTSDTFLYAGGTFFFAFLITGRLTGLINRSLEWKKWNIDLFIRSTFLTVGAALLAAATVSGPIDEFLETGKTTLYWLIQVGHYYVMASLAVILGLNIWLCFMHSEEAMLKASQMTPAEQQALLPDTDPDM